MKFFLLILLFIFHFTLFASSIVESVVANMNDRAITYTELLQEGELLNIENNVPPETQLSVDLKEKTLNLIMFRIIVFQEARDQNITVDEEDVRQKVKTYMANVYMKDFLRKYEITPLEFSTMIKMRLIADRMTELFLEKRFRDTPPGIDERKKAVEEWQKNLLKKQKLVLYSIP